MNIATLIKRLLICSVICLSGTWGERAFAITIQYNFAGVITSGECDLPGFSYSVGDAFNGSIFYDYSPGAFSPDPGEYTENTGISYIFNLNGYSWQNGDFPTLGVSNNGYNGPDYLTIGDSAPSWWVIDEFMFSFRDSTGTVLQDNSLPTDLLLSSFDSGTIGGEHYYPSGPELYGMFFGEITSISTVPVPEPTTMIIFSTGLAALACFKRRSKATPFS